MASDSESSHTGTHSQGLSPMPGFPEDGQSRRVTKLGEMLSPQSARRRISVKGELPGIMKRAASSPNVRDLASLDTSGMTSAEKKRNKLGYHRTAVACVHCRRRKIRCILAMDDPTTRCHNCIRLKKDCQFYPVDQQPTPGKRTRSSSKTEEAMNDSPSPETSPNTLGTSWDHPEGYSAAPFQVSTVSSEQAGQFAFSGPVLHSDSTGLSSASYSSSNMFSQSSWSSTPVLTSPSQSIDLGAFEVPHPAQWQPTAQLGPSSYEFSPYPPSATETPLHPSARDTFSHYSGAHVGEPHSWSQLPHHPVRSMSLANPHDLQNYHSPFHNDPHMFLQRHPTNMSDIHPPSLSSNTNPTPPSSDTHSTPSAYAYGDHAQMGTPYHTGGPMQSPSMAISGSEGFGQAWYSVPTGLADVKEEEELGIMHHHSISGHYRQSAG